jgi:4-hydroxy-tetrahydrodipicolinate synthase
MVTGELYPLHGVVSVLLTPFDADGRLDLPSLDRSIEDRIAAGAGGLLVLGAASEASRLRAGERWTLIRRVARQVGDRVPVIAGTSSPDLGETRSIAELACELGLAGVMVQSPEAVETAAGAGVAMIMLQDLDWHGPGLAVDVICDLFERVDALRCVKVETVPAGPKYTALLEATGGRLNVSGGWASTQLIEALDRGVHAFMPSAHHRVYAEILRRYRAGARDEARALFEQLLPVLAFTTQHIDVSIQFQKLLEVRRGIFATAAVRSPAIAFDAAHRRMADELLNRALELTWST